MTRDSHGRCVTCGAAPSEACDQWWHRIQEMFEQLNTEKVNQ